MAAIGPPADSQATGNPWLVPHTNLPQLNAHLEHGNQILHQLPEIHPLVGTKEEQHLLLLQQVMHRNELHLQLVVGGLLLKNLEGVTFLFLQAGSLLHISFVCLAINGNDISGLDAHRT